MRNFINYVYEETLTFEQKPLNEIDSLVLSWLSNLHYPSNLKFVESKKRIPIKDLLDDKELEQLAHSCFDPQSTVKLLKGIKNSPRFQDLMFSNHVHIYDQNLQEQFSATTFHYKDLFSYVSFRGTDNTIIGWKEDLNMGFECPVPAQIGALKYLTEIFPTLNKDIYLGGHSKGGNLAVFAGVMANLDIDQHIIAMYSHDGPGFLDSFFNSANFITRKNKIFKTVPEFSIVGLIMEKHEDYKIVKSNGISIFQHNPFSWFIRKDTFYEVPKLDKQAQNFDSHLNDAISNFPKELRKEAIDDIYSIFSNANITLTNEIPKNFPKIIASYKNLSPDRKELIQQLFDDIFAKKRNIKRIPRLKTPLLVKKG